MKKIAIITNLVLAISLSLTVACEKSDMINSEDELLNISAEEYLSNLKASFVETTELTGKEKEMLIYMREEEKLARDVYYALYNKWGNLVFSNISRSEENHIAAIISLMEFYDLAETEILEQGEFENENLGELYNQLVAKGSVSLANAMEVGATIEELDLKDLMDDLDATENVNIQNVFNNLARGSRNHLRAFNNQLVNNDITYVPQYISQEDFYAIVNSPQERGYGYGKGSGNGQRKGKGNGNRRQGNCNNN